VGKERGGAENGYTQWKGEELRDGEKRRGGGGDAVGVQGNL